MSKIDQVVNSLNGSIKHLTETFQKLSSPEDHENENEDDFVNEDANESKTKPTLSSEIAPIHAISLASNLYKMYKDGVATDINVVCQEQTFQLHSAVLIHGSQYFRRILLKNAENHGEDYINEDSTTLIPPNNSSSNSTTFNLEFNPPIEPSTFEIVLESLYTGMVRNMNEYNVTSLLEAYYHLDIDYAYKACVQFMLRHLDMDNCLAYWLAGKFCDSAKVQNKAIGLMGRHLKSFYKTTEFLELQSNTIIEILEQDTLQVPSEKIVFEAAMAWIKYDEERRGIEIKNILEVVRLTYLPAFYLVNIVGKEDLIENDRDAMVKYSKALKLKLANRYEEDTTQRHHSIHGVRGGLEKIKKQIEDSTCIDNEVEDCKGKIVNGVEECKEKIESMKAKRREQLAARRREQAFEHVDDNINPTTKNEEDYINELEFEEDDVGNTHTRSLLEPEPIDQPQQEEEVQEKPKSFMSTFLEKLKTKKTNALETVNDEANEVKKEEPKSDEYEENQFSISYQRLQSLPEGSDEDLSEEPSTKCESKTGLSYSNEERENKKTSNENLIQLEIEPDIVRSIVNGDVDDVQYKSEEDNEGQDNKVKEGDLLNLELPQDLGANQNNHHNDDDSFDF